MIVFYDLMVNKIMPKLHTFEFCDRVKEDESGKKTLYGLFKFINTVFLPTKHKEFTIVLGYSKGNGDFNGKTIIKNPSGMEIYKNEYNLNLESQYTDTYALTKVENLQLMEMGIYKMLTYLENNLMGERTFIVGLKKFTELSDEEIKEKLKDENTIKSVKLELICPNCGNRYIFQMNLDPDEPIDNDSIEIPEDDIFRCPNDDFEINLTGVRLSLQSKLGQPKEEFMGDKNI